MNVYRQTANELDKLNQDWHGKPFYALDIWKWLLKQQLRVMESTAEAWQTMIEGQRGFLNRVILCRMTPPPITLSYYTTDKLRDPWALLWL